MQCPKCQHLDTKVIDSRLTDGNRVIRRRRECEKCNSRFTTFEKTERNNFLVIKKDGNREPYNREKLHHGIVEACHKRPVSQDAITKVIDEMEEQWSSKGKEISTEEIGEELMIRLKTLDHVAYIRFASVYKEFHDLEDFKSAILSLGKGK